jgi:hypothetical protein
MEKLYQVAQRMEKDDWLFVIANGLVMGFGFSCLVMSYNLFQNNKDLGGSVLIIGAILFMIIALDRYLHQ